MKKITLLTLCLLTILSAVAQEFNRPSRVHFTPPASHNNFILPDSLSHLSPWRPEPRPQSQFTQKPTISMTSVIAVKKPLVKPNVLQLLNNNSVRVKIHVSISNGQAYNFSPFPDAFLDARTLSMPLPRK